MKITINTVKLQEMVSKAVKGARNNALTALSTLMCIEHKGDILTITTTDRTNYLYIRQDGVDGEDFYVVVEVDKFSKIVSKITSETITLEVVDSKELIVVGNGKYTIELELDGDGNTIQYPDPYSEVENNKYDETVDYVDIVCAINTIKPSLAVGTSTPILNNYCVSNKVIGTNRNIITTLNRKLFKKDVLISSDLMDLLGLLVSETIKVKITEDYMLFYTPNAYIYSNVLGDVDEYPVEKISSLVNMHLENTCTVAKHDILNTLDRMSIFIGIYDSGTIKLSFSKDGLTIYNKDEHSDELIPYIEGLIDEKTFECYIKLDSLLTQVKSCMEDTITIGYGDDSLIQIFDGDDIVKVIALENE